MPPERRQHPRRKPPQQPMQARVQILLATGEPDPSHPEFLADVIETSPSGLRLASHVGDQVAVGMALRLSLWIDGGMVQTTEAVVQWVEHHPWIHTFGALKRIRE